MEYTISSMINGDKTVGMNNLVQEFKKTWGIYKVLAFCGGAEVELAGIEDTSDIYMAYKELMLHKQALILDQIIKRLKNFRVAILTGGTKEGVPETATALAKKHGLLTIGVYPLTGKKRALGEDLLDISFCVEPNLDESFWGDETPILTALLDAAIVYGGGAGTLVEVAHLFKINDKLLGKGIRPKYIVPISGSGGVADQVPFIWGKPQVKSKSIPPKPITNGSEAFQFLEINLDLYENAYKQ